MIRNSLSAAVLAMSLSGPVLAQDVQQLAQDYVAMPEVQKMMADMFSPQSMLAQFEAGLPPSVQLTEDQRSQIGALLSSAMLDMQPQMEAQMTTGAAKHFTADELSALIAFYSSEHGAAVMGKMQPFFQDVMGQMTPQITQVMQQVTPKIIQIIQGG